MTPDQINAEALNALMLQRSTQQALARALPPSSYDVAWSALLDLVELRARKMFPDRFDPPVQEGAVPHVSRVSTS